VLSRISACIVCASARIILRRGRVRIPVPVRAPTYASRGSRRDLLHACCAGQHARQAPRGATSRTPLRKSAGATPARSHAPSEVCRGDTGAFAEEARVAGVWHRGRLSRVRGTVFRSEGLESQKHDSLSPPKALQPAAVRCYTVLYQAFRARRSLRNGVGGEVLHGATSGVSRETSGRRHVTPHLHRECGR